ncbi:MAG: hypothetical protein AAFO62_04115 [Pseudomonadota bacterium]
MTDGSAKPWEQIDHDPVSDRRIFKREIAFGQGGFGGHEFELTAEFEVRDGRGRVLARFTESAKGEYWCGAFLWFVKGSDGTRVRLSRSDRREDEVHDVPDTPRRDVTEGERA